MALIVGVRFKSVGKVYYFDPGELSLSLGDKVVVETSRGIECGEVALEQQEMGEEDLLQPLKKILRIATQEDLDTVAENLEKQKKAFEIGQEKIKKHGLDMTLIDVEYTFDGNKILFYFTAEGRIDFRELVKDLASVFRTRIELRQIGVRDEAKLLGGLGICGRPFCCSTFLDEFQPVSIKMAKEQGLSLNPTKISGTCGRLMCCLKYEQEAYEDLLRTTPRAGSLIDTEDGRGIVTDVNLLTGKLTVRLDAFPDAAPKIFHKNDVTLLKNGSKSGKRDQSAHKDGGLKEKKEERLAQEPSVRQEESWNREDVPALVKEPRPQKGTQPKDRPQAEPTEEPAQGEQPHGERSRPPRHRGGKGSRNRRDGAPKEKGQNKPYGEEQTPTSQQD